jgi:hypothetical protein
MPAPFANTLRCLNADRFRGSLIGLGVALVLLLAWSGWFLLARITIYETSASAEVAGDGFIVADFPAAKFQRIRRGQAAWLYPIRDGAKQLARIPAVVFDIDRARSAEPARVKLFPVLDRDLGEILPADQKVRVEIEVEAVSPAAMVLRTSGLLADTPGVALSPQPKRGD